MRHRKPAKTAKLSGTLLPPAALVFNDPAESEQSDGRRVWVHLDLEKAFLARRHGRSVIEAQRLQFAAEGDHLWGERTPKVSSVTTCVDAAKVGISPMENLDSDKVFLDLRSAPASTSSTA